MTTPTRPDKTTDELIEEVLSLVTYSRAFRIEVMFAVTVLETEQGDWCGAVGCLYASESKSGLQGQPTIPLAPNFYPAEVARRLEQRGLISPVHTSRRTGLDVHWFQFATSFA